jgi:hypothetical protein
MEAQQRIKIYFAIRAQAQQQDTLHSLTGIGAERLFGGTPQLIRRQARKLGIVGFLAGAFAAQCRHRFHTGAVQSVDHMVRYRFAKEI